MAAMDVQVRIRAIDQFSATLDRLQKKLRDLDGGRGSYARPGDRQGAAYGRMVEDRRQQMGSIEKGLGGAVAPLGITPGLLGAGAIGLGIKEAVTAAADFESSLTNIQKKAGTTAAQTAKIGEEIKALATSGELAVPIEEIAAGYERGAAAGIPLGELKEFATLSAKASDAFEMSATDVGNAAAGFKTVLKIPMSEMEKYFDLINGLADSGIADESGIVNFVDRAGAMSKTFGLSAQQTAALGASLANLKVPAEVGATAINSIFANLLAPQAMSKAGQKAFTSLIGNNKKFAKSVEQDANGAFIELLETLGKLDVATRTGLVVDIFGKEHMDTMLQMVEGVEQIKKDAAYAASTEWFGSLDKSYALKLDDMKSQWQVFKNQASELMIDVGTAGMPAVMEGLEGAKYLVDQIGQGFEKFKLNLNMDEIGKAGAAIADLTAAMTKLIGIDTSQAAIPQFFKEMADAANDIAYAINKVDEFFGPIKPADIPAGGGQAQAIDKSYADIQGQLSGRLPAEGSKYPSPPRVAQPMIGPAAEPGGLSPTDTAIRDIDRQIAALVKQEQQLSDAFKITPSPDTAKTLRSITDEMASLNERRDQIETGEITPPETPRTSTRMSVQQGPTVPRDGFGGYGPQIPATPTARPDRAAIPTRGPSPDPSFADQRRPEALKPIVPQAERLVGREVSVDQLDLGRSTGLIPTPRPSPMPPAPPPVAVPSLSTLTPPVSFAVPPQAEIDAMVSAYQAARGALEVPILMPTPTIDTTAALTNLTTLKSASAEAGAPISAVADVNIGPAMAKLAQLRSAAASTAAAVNASLATAGSGGGGGNFNARVRDQF